ncbi:MAG: hypothetical protein LBM23_04695 [Propionibacteriaceae bacterium]|jgi:hypothetical protein|nr:hypothetical protein [Propionibacteriaceae bacterium]
MTIETVERMLPLYEAKMIHLYDHRWATYEGEKNARLLDPDEKRDPTFAPSPRYWVREELVSDRLGETEHHPRLLGWRDICRNTDARTMVDAQFPIAAVGHTMPLALTNSSSLLLQAVWSSFAFDYVARQKVGGTHMTYGYLTQIATIDPSVFSNPCPWAIGQFADWITSRVATLSCTSWSMAPMAKELTGRAQVVEWNPDHRALIRAELDAAMFHLYGIARDDVDYIMETFPIVKEHDIEEHGEYRTKRLILENFDAMNRAIAGEEPFRSAAEPFLLRSADQ